MADRTVRLVLEAVTAQYVARMTQASANALNAYQKEALTAAADVYAVQNALPPRFQARDQWCANIAILNAQFETTNGALKFLEVDDNRPCFPLCPTATAPGYGGSTGG